MLTNNTDSAINVSKDLSFYSGNHQVIPMEPALIKNILKQIVPVYIPYLLLTFVNLTVTKITPSNTTTNVYPIGLVLGPVITIGNMAVAGSGNSNMLMELNEYNILNKDIKKGETIYGIIGIRDIGYSPISVRLKE